MKRTKGIGKTNASAALLSGRRTGHRPLIVIVGLVLVCATMLLNDVPERRRDASPGAWPPSLFSRMLMAPVPMTGMTDLRWYALPTGLAAMLVWFSVRRIRPDTTARNPSEVSAQSSNVSRKRSKKETETGQQSIRNPQAEMGDHPSSSSDRRASVQDGWFEGLAVFTATWALCSATINGTMSVSLGWVFALVVGCGWAVWISRFVAMHAAEAIVFVASGILAVGAMLALWHRYAMGSPFFELPIGPVTITAPLAAMGLSFTLIWLLGSILFRGQLVGGELRPLSLIWSMLIGLVLFMLLATAARRGAWIALAASVTAMTSLMAFGRFRGRPIRGVLLIGGVIGFLAAGFHFQQNVLSPRATATSSVQVRAEYWRHLLSELPARFLFGKGPNTFAFEMTTAMALTRADQPRFFRGRVDYEAHNEWLQAAFELGLPGAAAYLGMPLGVILLAIRRWKRSPSEPAAALVLACAAGLIVVLVSELGSINLRHPILHAWYWTLLGVGLALLRSQPLPANDAGRFVKSSLRYRGAALVAAILILLVVGVDIRRGMAHEQGRMAVGKDDELAVGQLEAAIGRMGVRNWLWTRTDLAGQYSNQLRAARRSAEDVAEVDGRRAVALWREVYEACPGYPDAGYRLAEAMLLTGDKVSALAVVTDYLNRIDPYDRQANLLRIQLGGQSAIEKVNCIRRALRSSPIDGRLASLALRDLTAESAGAEWANLVDRALRDTEADDPSQWADPLAPETLRLEALRLTTTGELPRAAHLARQAADAYGQLAERGAAVRRAAAVEADAWYLAARMLFESQPAQYATCFDLIRRAEQSARLELAAAPGRSPQDLDLSPVALRRRTPELRQLLRFSGQMHLAAGADLREVARRANWSIPGDSHTQAQVDAEVGRMAAELLDAFGAIAEPQRPPNMAQLAQLARRATP